MYPPYSGGMTPLQTRTLERPSNGLRTRTLERPSNDLQTRTLERPSNDFQTRTLERPSNDLQTRARAPHNFSSDEESPLVFSPRTRDHRMKGHKYGHFSKKAVAPKSLGDKENIRTFFDRNASRDLTAIQTPRTMMSTETSPVYTAFNSAFSSRMA